MLREDPDNREAKQSLELAKIRASLDHYARARRYEASGRLDESLVELQVASELNPGNADIDDALRNVRIQLRNKVAVEGRQDRAADAGRTIASS